MSPNLKPPTLNTFPTFINRKLYALNSDPKEADLDPIRDLLDVFQEDRVLSDEELQEWKKTEKKVLGNQNVYKERRKNTGMCFLRLFLFFILFVKVGFKILQFILGVRFPEDYSLACWPIDFFLVAIYILLLYRSDLRLKPITPKPVEPVDNEEEEDDDWEDSMTSTELQSRQKALVDGWIPLKNEKTENSGLDFWCFLSRYVNMVYFSIRTIAILYNTSCLTKQKTFFVNFEWISSYLIFGFISLEIVKEKGWLRAAVEILIKYHPVYATLHRHGYFKHLLQNHENI